MISPISAPSGEEFLSLDNLLSELRGLVGDPELRGLVESKIRSFKAVRSRGRLEIFKELVFCILAAGFSASRSMEIVEELGERLMKLDEMELARELRRLGHRFPEARARYIVEARGKLDEILRAIERIGDEGELREWLVENVGGLGYKEASHFMRNIGFQDVAIIDFHVLNVLRRFGLIEPWKALTRRRYMEVEEILREVAREAGLTLAELDLYLWYLDAGKILK